MLMVTMALIPIDTEESSVEPDLAPSKMGSYKNDDEHSLVALDGFFIGKGKLQLGKEKQDRFNLETSLNINDALSNKIAHEP